MPGDIASALIGAGGSVLGSTINAISQGITNKQNLDYARSLTQQQWERDDTSYQRSVSDAVKAGLSPLAALGGSSNSSAMPFTAQAPQLDVNSMTSAFGKLGDTIQNKLQFDKSFEHQVQVDTDESNRLWTELTHNIELDDKKFDQEVSEFNQNMKYLNDSLANNKWQFKTKTEFDAFKYQQEQMIGQLPEGVSNIQTFDNYDSWLSANTQWIKDYNNFLSQLGSDSTSHLSSTSGGANAGITGIANIGGNASNTESDSENVSTKIKNQVNSFFIEHPYPVYTGTFKTYKIQDNQ